MDISKVYYINNQIITKLKDNLMDISKVHNLKKAI